MLLAGIEHVGALPHRILRAELGPHDDDGVSLAHHLIGNGLAVNPYHAQGKRVGFGDGALAFVAGGHRHIPHFGQFLQLLVGSRYVHPVARHQYRSQRLGQYFHNSLNILGRALGFGGVQVAAGGVDERWGLQVNLTANGRTAHEHCCRAGPAAGGVLDG